MSRYRFVVVVSALLVIGAPVAALAQDPGATASPTGGSVSVVAAGLTNPRGFTWGADGTLYVAEAGTGGTTAASGDPAVPPPVGPWTGGPTASVAWIADGCPVPLVDGLPSAVNALGEVGGVADVAVMAGKLYVLITGGGASHGNPDAPNGVYEVTGSGIELVADLERWIEENPVAEVPADYEPSGSFFAMEAGDGAFWVVESNSEQVLTVTLDGTVTRVADLSATDQVPTGIALAPGGGAYVGFLTSVPHPDGAAKVVKVEANGTVTDAWTGLTMVTGVAVDAEGTLYAAEMATGNSDEAPFYEPGTGKIVRQTGPDQAEEVAIGLTFPVAIDFGDDDALYVAMPAIGAENGEGLVIRLDVTRGGVVGLGETTLTPPACGGATPEATEEAAAENEVTIRIVDFAFEPQNVEIKVGTTVTWINDGPTAHTVAAYDGRDKVWDSNILDAGESYSFTFTEPASYDYLCTLHPTMTAHLDVVE